mgnify:CR=1 FL=1
MQKTRIEWCDYTVNPVKGLCPMACSYCYARRMYKRFGWNPEIRYDVTLLNYEQKPHFPDGSKVFVGSTMELFGHWIDSKWLSDIFHDCWSRYPKVTFIFLTKQPTELKRWSPFPANCWVGCSATNSEQAVRAMMELYFIDAPIKFLSLEPLLSNEGYTKWGYIDFKKINWLIIGQQTPVSDTTLPHVQDIQQIIQGVDSSNGAVFLKNNLSAFLPFRQYFAGNDAWTEVYRLRQEFPNG